MNTQIDTSWIRDEAAELKHYLAQPRATQHHRDMFGEIQECRQHLCSLLAELLTTRDLEPRPLKGTDTRTRIAENTWNKAYYDHYFALIERGDEHILAEVERLTRKEDRRIIPLAA